MRDIFTAHLTFARDCNLIPMTLLLRTSHLYRKEYRRLTLESQIAEAYVLLSSAQSNHETSRNARD